MIVSGAEGRERGGGRGEKNFFPPSPKKKGERELCFHITIHLAVYSNKRQGGREGEEGKREFGTTAAAQV